MRPGLGDGHVGAWQHEVPGSFAEFAGDVGETGWGLMSSVRRAPSSETVKPCGTSRGSKTSDPGLAGQPRAPQWIGLWPSGM
jgi:hypothetical protein